MPQLIVPAAALGRSQQNTVRIPDNINPNIDVTEQVTLDLGDDLKHHPLALAHAATYLRESGCSAMKYRLMLEDRRQSSQYNLSVSSSLPEPVDLAFRLLFDLVHLENPRSTRILSLMSVLNIDNIPELLLLNNGESLKSFRAAIRKLQDFNFIHVSTDALGGWPDGTRLSMDGMVQICVQTELQRQKALIVWQSMAGRVLSERFPHGDSSHWRACHTLMPHVEKVLTYPTPDHYSKMNRAGLLRNVASFQEHQGDFETASENLQKALKLYENDPDLDEESRLPVEVEKSIIRMLVYQENFEEAEKRARKMLEKLEMIFREDHPYHFQAMAFSNSLASIVHQQGKFAEAEKLYIKALHSNVAFHYDEHVDTFHIKNNLAGLYVDMGNYTKAEAMHDEVLAAQERLQGPAHHDVIYTKRLLARAIAAQGRYSVAADKQREVLALAERVLGVEHPDTLQARNDLASTSTSLGDFATSESLHRQILASRLKSSNSEKPGVIISRLNLGVVLERQGKYEDAATMLKLAIDPAITVLGERHPTTLKLRNTLGLVYLRQGDFIEGETIIRPLLAINVELYGTDHYQTLIVRNNLAGCLQRQGRWDEAIEYHRRTMEGAAKTMTSAHPFSLRSMNNVAEVLREAAEARMKDPQHDPAEINGILTEAKQLQQRAFEERQSVLGKGNPDTLTSCFNLGQVLHAQGQYEKALEMYNSTLDGLEEGRNAHIPVAKACREKMVLLERDMHPGAARKA